MKHIITITMLVEGVDRDEALNAVQEVLDVGRFQEEICDECIDIDILDVVAT